MVPQHREPRQAQSCGSCNVVAECAKSSTLIRASASENAVSASAKAGATTSLSSGKSITTGFVLDSPRCAQDVVGRNPPAVAGEFVTAARSPRPSQDALSHQGLQHRFQQSGWKVMARS
jgi:hypothetical protein